MEWFWEKFAVTVMFSLGRKSGGNSIGLVTDITVEKVYYFKIVGLVYANKVNLPIDFVTFE